MPQTKSYRKERVGRTRKKAEQTRERQRSPNLSYQTEEDRVLSSQREDLEKEEDIEEEADVPELRACLVIPDGDEDDGETYEPEEDVQQSEDWDRSSELTQAEDIFGRGEPTLFSEGAENERIPPPDIVVDCEETLQGPVLHVQVAGRLNESRKRAVQERQRRLLDVARYIVSCQRDFFLRKGPLNPLNEADIARNLWPSEKLENKKEDLSRLVSNKWVRTPWGEVLRMEDLCPNNADMLLEQIRDILREQDHVGTKEGHVVVDQVIPVHSKRGISIVAELRKRLRNSNGCSQRTSSIS